MKGWNNMYFGDKLIRQWHRIAQNLFSWIHAFPKDVNISAHQVCSRNTATRRTMCTSENWQHTATMDAAVQNIQGRTVYETPWSHTILARTATKTQQFVTAIVERRSYIVALRKVILHLGEDFLRNNISNILSDYTEKRNN
jgi:hypothetical protein